MTIEQQQPDAARFDAHVRSLHQSSLTQLSPHVKWKLRPAQASPATGIAGWFQPLIQPNLVAGASALLAVAVVGLGAWFSLPFGQAPVTPVTQGALATGLDQDDAGSVLDQDPDFYAWLASDDVSPLAME